MPRDNGTPERDAKRANPTASESFEATGALDTSHLSEPGDIWSGTDATGRPNTAPLDARDQEPDAVPLPSPAQPEDPHARKSVGEGRCPLGAALPYGRGN